MRAILASVLSLLIAGCTIPLAIQQASLAGRAVCCSSLSEFKYSPLASNQKMTVEISEVAPAYVFPGGKSYFAAFKLEQKPNRTLFVESEFNGPLIGQFFQTTCLFLDADYKPLQTITPALSFVPHSYSPYADAHMAGELKVPDNSEFVVVHTSDFSDMTVTATIQVPASIILTGRIPIVTQNPEATISLQLSPTGTITLSIK